MKLVYTHENPLMVAQAKNLLELQGLEVILKNEFARGALGEISTLDAWQEVWVVKDKDYLPAIEIIKSANKVAPVSHWLCAECGEENSGSFEHCWNCQHERPEIA